MENRMKVIPPGRNNWEYLSPMNALGLEKKNYKCISIVGAGGKTTTLEALAKDCLEKKLPAFVTTTTHMFYPGDRWVFTDSQDEEYIRTELDKCGILWLGRLSGMGKIEAPTEEVIDFILDSDTLILIEADGAKRLPFKFPGKMEPVILKNTDCVLGVIGMDALGCRMDNVCFRAEDAAHFLSKKKDELLTEMDYVKVIKSKDGLMKGVEPSMDFKVILNKADTKERTEYAFCIRNLLNVCGIKEVYITSHR